MMKVKINLRRKQNKTKRKNYRSKKITIQWHGMDSITIIQTSKECRASWTAASFSQYKSYLFVHLELILCFQMKKCSTLTFLVLLLDFVVLSSFIYKSNQKLDRVSICSSITSTIQTISLKFWKAMRGKVSLLMMEKLNIYAGSRWLST